MTRVLSLIFLVVTFAAIWYVSSRRSPPDATDTGVRELTTMQDYRDLNIKSRQKVVVIGLDGATWDIIDPMIESGALPTFERLKREGAWGDLRSVDCYMSPPAWTSMMTGFSPERTGIYTFGKWLPEEREFMAFSSLDVEVPHVWDIASVAGRRVAVTNVPLTYPALPVSGIMVSGLMTPIVYRELTPTRTLRFEGQEEPFDATLDARSFSKPLDTTWVLSRASLAIVLYDTRDDNTANYDTVALKVFPTGERWSMNEDVPIVTFPMDEFSPFFQITYRMPVGEKRETRQVAMSVRLGMAEGSDAVHLDVTPLLRVPTDPDLRMTYPESLANEIEEKFGYYLITMTHTPDLIAQGTGWTADFAAYFYDYENWDLFFYVFQAPDNAHHADGAGETTSAVYQTIDRFLAQLIEKLPPDATLILASDHGFQRYDYVVSLNDYLADLGLLSNPRDVDYDHTLVFHNQWCLYFNDALLTASELERRGITIGSGQTPRQALVAHLQSACSQLTHLGRPMPIELVDVPDTAVGNAPDMIVIGSYEDYFVEGADLDITGSRIVRDAERAASWFHNRRGMFLVWGNQIRRGLNAGEKNIEDMTPTILYLLDLPMAPDFDGVVWEDLIKPEITGSKKRFVVLDFLNHSPDRDFTVKELQTLEDKLRTLGYVR